MDLVCKNCESPFELIPNIYRRRLKKNKLGLFCKSECVQEWLSKNLKKEKPKKDLQEDGLKSCCYCKNFLPVNAFGSHGGKTTSACKSCFSTYVGKRFHAKKIAACKFLGDKCNKCNQTFPYQVYNFHHVDPKTKSFEWSSLRLQSIETILTELAKCELLCANCHLVEHSEGVTWNGLDKMTNGFLTQMMNRKV